MVPMFPLSMQAVAKKICNAIKFYAEKWGTRIMQDDSRAIVEWSERERQVVFESDTCAIFEDTLQFHIGDLQ